MIFLLAKNNTVEQCLNTFKKSSYNNIKQTRTHISIEIENYQKEIQSYEIQLANPNLSNEEKITTSCIMNVAKETLVLLKANLKDLNKKSARKSNKDFLSDKRTIKEVDESFHAIKVIETLLKVYSCDNTLDSNSTNILIAIKENLIAIRQSLNKAYKIISNINYTNRNNSLIKLHSRIDNLIISQDNMHSALDISKTCPFFEISSFVYIIKIKLTNLKNTIAKEIEKTTPDESDKRKKEKIKNTPNTGNSKYSRKYLRQQERQQSKRITQKLEHNFF